MRFTTILGTFFYSLFFFIIGLSIIAFVTHWITIGEVDFLLQSVYSDINLRIIWGIVGALLMLLNVSFVQILVGRFQKQKNIAFMNPNGEVTISLAAVEGLIKRLTADIAEIKELKPEVLAGKKGINISLKVVLWSEINIPDITSKLQDLIKSKVQEMLGIEESIIVRVHVVKIVAANEESRAGKDKKESEPTVPFQGYRA